MVLSGLIGRGFGIQSICFLLDLGREALLDLVIEFGMTTPHDQPFRQPQGGKYWTARQNQLLIKGWMLNWRADDIAAQTERSRSSVYAKVRRLALPKRDRRLLHTPRPREAVQSACDSVVDSVPAPPREWFVKNASYPVLVKRHPSRNEIIWTTEMFELMFKRRLAGQTYHDMAKDFGIPPVAMRSKISAVGIPPVSEFRHLRLSIAEAEARNIADFGYQLLPRKKGRLGTFYIQNRKTMNMSREDKRIISKEQSMFY